MAIRWLIETKNKDLILFLVSLTKPSGHVTSAIQSVCKKKTLAGEVSLGLIFYENIQNIINLVKAKKILLIIFLPSSRDHALRLSLYDIPHRFDIPLENIKFYTELQPDLRISGSNFTLNLSMFDYISSGIDSSVDVKNLQQWLEYNLYKLKWEKDKAIRHILPSAIGGAMEYLIKYRNNHDDFSIPPDLYVFSVNVALADKNLDSKSLSKFIFRLPAESTLEKKGFCEDFVQELTGNNEISRSLAEYRLARDSPQPMAPKDLYNPPINCFGKAILFQYLGFDQCEEEIPIFISIVVILLQEAIEHTERYIRNHQTDENRKSIQVLIHETSSITIKNPCAQDARPLGDGDNQKASVDFLASYLSTWQVNPPEISEDSWWVRRLILRNEAKR